MQASQLFSSHQILNNCGCLYRVDLFSYDTCTSVKIFKRKPVKEVIVSESEYNNYELFLTFLSKEVLIGKSLANRERTSWEQSFGSSYDGNTLLFKSQMDDSYIFVGDEIYLFTPKSQIVQYESPVGLSGSTYPWLLDISNNIYLLAENKIGCVSEEIKSLIDQGKDPYMFLDKIDSIQEMNIKILDEPMKNNIE